MTVLSVCLDVRGVNLDSWSSACTRLTFSKLMCRVKRCSNMSDADWQRAESVAREFRVGAQCAEWYDICRLSDADWLRV